MRESVCVCKESESVCLIERACERKTMWCVCVCVGLRKRDEDK